MLALPPGADWGGVFAWNDGRVDLFLVELLTTTGAGKRGHAEVERARSALGLGRVGGIVHCDLRPRRSTRFSNCYPRGIPRPRPAITLRWISLVPPPIVEATDVR